MSDRPESAQTRTQRLKALRERYRDSVSRVQAQVKAQNEIRRQIRQVFTSEARTVPEIAQACGLPADQVFWHIMAMRKYGQVEEQGMDGQYYRYQWKKGQPA